MVQVDILKVLKSTCEGWIYEYKFDSLRGFKFDYANLRLKVAIEIEGGIYTGTGHARTGRYLSDMEKYNMASIKGWIILRYGHGQEKKIAGDVKKAIEKRRSDIAFKDEIEKVGKVEKSEKVGKVEKSEKVGKVEKSEKVGRVEKSEKVGRVEKSEKVERVEKSEKVERVEKSEKVERVEKSEKLEKK